MIFGRNDCQDTSHHERAHTSNTEATVDLSFVLWNI